MRKAEKIERAKQIRKIFEENRYFIFVDFKGLNVAQFNALRRALKEANCGIKVVKNRVALKVIDGTPAEPGKEVFRGNTAVAYTKDDVGKFAKILYDFAKENEALTFKGAVVDNKFLGPESIEELSKLPTREELLARFAAAMAAPLVQFGRAMGMPLVLFANALQQLKQKKEQESK